MLSYASYVTDGLACPNLRNMLLSKGVGKLEFIWGNRGS